jgi:hypothetical protein
VVILECVELEEEKFDDERLEFVTDEVLLDKDSFEFVKHRVEFTDVKLVGASAKTSIDLTT